MINLSVLRASELFSDFWPTAFMTKYYNHDNNTCAIQIIAYYMNPNPEQLAPKYSWITIYSFRPFEIKIIKKYPDNRLLKSQHHYYFNNPRIVYSIVYFADRTDYEFNLRLSAVTLYTVFCFKSTEFNTTVC